jgi:hypothetical protein
MGGVEALLMCKLKGVPISRAPQWLLDEAARLYPGAFQ